MIPSRRPCSRSLRALRAAVLLLVSSGPVAAHGQTAVPMPPAAPIQTEAPAAPPPPPLTDTPPPPLAAPSQLPAPPPPVPPQPETAPAAPAEAPALSGEPLAGVSDQSMFLRSPDNMFVFFPNGRLQNDAYFYAMDNRVANKVPSNAFLIKRARLELSGWIANFAYFSIAGDFAAGPPATAGVPTVQTNLNTTDDYVALAPFGTIAMFQYGQYDAPFTLENRTSDKYFDFMERSITVRAFGIPQNKEVGGMILGYNEKRNFYYSVGLFNGDGQNFKNIDNQFDWMGRAWIAPFSFLGDGPLHDIEVGGSFWTGDRAGNTYPTLPLPNQTTQGGFTFLNFGSFTPPMAATGLPTGTSAIQLRQVGRVNAAAFEINAPIAHKGGVRYEFVWKHSPLSEEAISSSGSNLGILGGANLKGYSMYGEGWYWLLGDDRIIGDQQGIQPYTRFRKFGVKPPQQGVMLAFRFEYLNENLTEEADAATAALGSSALGRTKLQSYELGVNYWWSKRFRATFNYVLNHFDRGAEATKQLRNLSTSTEQEFGFRLAIAL
jgi:phosphate-selective porin